MLRPTDSPLDDIGRYRCEQHIDRASPARKALCDALQRLGHVALCAADEDDVLFLLDIMPLRLIVLEPAALGKPWVLLSALRERGTWPIVVWSASVPARQQVDEAVPHVSKCSTSAEDAAMQLIRHLSPSRAADAIAAD